MASDQRGKRGSGRVGPGLSPGLHCPEGATSGLVVFSASAPQSTNVQVSELVQAERKTGRAVCECLDKRSANVVGSALCALKRRGCMLLVFWTVLGGFRVEHI